MRFVVFDAVTREIRSAVTGPEPMPEDGQLVGDVGEVQFDGALKNYIFVPAEPLQLQGATRGRVERKPAADWDLEAEEREFSQRRALMRFHQLDVTELREIHAQLMVYADFRKLPADVTEYQLTFEDVGVKATVRRLAAIPISAMFEYSGGGSSGYTIPLRRVIVSFSLSATEPFLQAALDRELRALDDTGKKLFASHVLKQEALWFGLRLTNHVIDCYRLAYGDWGARPLGIADVLDGVIVLELMDGLKQPQHSSLPASRYSRAATATGTEPEVSASERMKALLDCSAPPFIPIAVAEVRKARLYGQYREVVIWAGTIVANVIEEILLNGLSKDSPEYKRLRNSGKKVSGQTRRGDYFKKATGQTLREWLQSREVSGHSPRGLADDVESLLDLRNLLLHRKASVRATDSERAFGACMGFLAAVENLPFWKEDFPYEF